MTRQDWFLFGSTFIVGAATGMYLYTTSFKPLYDPDAIGGDEAAASEFSVVGRSYGGMTAPGYVHPSFRIEEGGTYSYFPGGTEDAVHADPIEGTLPRALWQELEDSIRTRDLAALSHPVVKDECRTFMDAPDYVYDVTLAGERYEIDTCATDIAYEDELIDTFNEIWSYLRDPASYERVGDAERDPQNFLSDFLRRRLDVDYEEEPEGPVACTMEAKICPDGSAVGRTGPNCEFAACPGE